MITWSLGEAGEFSSSPTTPPSPPHAKRSRHRHRYVPITPETPVTDLYRFFETNSVAFVTDGACKWVLGVCTKLDLMRFVGKVGPKVVV